MWTQKLSFIPLNVAFWLQDIRIAVEDDDELLESVAKFNAFQEVESSNDSLYDNVDFFSKKGNFIKCECEPVNVAPVFEKCHKKVFSETLYPTWPLLKRPTRVSSLSLQDLFKFKLLEGKMNAGIHLKSDSHRTNYFNSSSNTLLTLKRDITYEKRDLGESRTQEGEEPNLRASMSNLLASHREKHSQEYSGAWLNAENISFGKPSAKNLFRNSINDKKCLNVEITFLHKDNEDGNNAQMDEGLINYKPRDSLCKYPNPIVNCKSLPLNFAPISSINVKNIFNNEFLTDKPPVPPKRTNQKMYQKQCAVARSRKLRKAKFSKTKAVAIPMVRLKTKDTDVDSSVQKNLEDLKNEVTLDCLLESVGNNCEDFADKEIKKPLPFPAFNPKLEYEISELLMMQRATESSKERRRMSIESKPSPILEEPNDIFQGCFKSIPKSPQWSPSIQSTDKYCAEKMSDYDLSEFIYNLSDVVVDINCQDKVKQFLESRKNKLHQETKPKIPLKLRDVIIDWENDYENLNEPVVLEGKSVAKRLPDALLRHKIQINTEKKSQSVQAFVSKSGFYDENNEKTLDCFTSTVSTNELSCLVSDSSLPSQSSVAFEESDIGNSVELAKGRLKPESEITEIVTRYENILKESDPKCDTENFDKISFSSISDGLNSYSDFESDINETIAIGEIWYCENISEENTSIISCDVSMDATRGSYICTDDKDYDTLSHPKSSITGMDDEFEISLKSFSEVESDITVENCNNKTEEIAFEYEEDETKIDKLWVKSSSETNLIKFSRPKLMLGKLLSKSSDFFLSSLAGNRLELKCCLKKHESITSDVCEWMAEIRGIAFAEDQLFCNDNEWILSFDSEERAYFFEETSKQSLWALPDYSRESIKPEYNYAIQRSATESAINNETPTKLRLNKNGSQARISASTRSSKTQSMLIEPKLDISPKDENKTVSMPRDLSKIYGEIIRIGVLNKTKISENGKKLRKNWTPSFIVLTDSYLFFFKDAKSFQNMKNVISSNGNHMCLSLQGAVIEKGEKISSRKNVYRISCSDNTDVLIQTDKTSDAEEWFKEISSIIQKLPENPAVRSSPLLDSKYPSRVGRTKSLKVRSKDTGSMEDLSSTPEERQNKIKARLKKFFIRRPTVDSLKKKGIWKDEPVFGCSLEQITKSRNPRVPVFVEKCIECIESKEENMKTDGLYRASGNLSQVQKIRLEVDQNNLNIMKEEEDVHVLTGSLKLFFRELKEPLIPSKQLEPALLATDKHTRKERIKDFQKIVKSLPTPNYDTLKFLLQHLLRVKEYHKFNRMNINNLAIVFGPTLMWPEQESANMALELMQQNVVIECLLKEFQEIFT